MLTNLMSLMAVGAALAAAGAIAAAVLAPPYLLWSSIKGRRRGPTGDCARGGDTGSVAPRHRH